MRIGRLEMGIWKSEQKLTLKDYFEFSHDAGSCGCHIITVSRAYFTWLGDECYLDPVENEDK